MELNILCRKGVLKSNSLPLLKLIGCATCSSVWMNRRDIATAESG